MALRKPPARIGLYITVLKSGEEKYQSRLWSPITQRIDKKKTWQEKDLSVVVPKHYHFRKAYEDSNYGVITSAPVQKKEYPSLIRECAALYHRYLTDDPRLVPTHQAKNRDNKYIKNSITYIKTFLDILKSNGYDPTHTDINAVDDSIVGLLYEHLETRFHNKEIGEVTWNRHFVTCSNWFKYLVKIEVIKYNPFADITKKTINTDPQFLEIDEMWAFLSQIKPKNGWGERGVIRIERVNYYREWLIELFLLDVYIGARPNEFFSLRWPNVEGNYVVVTNSKLENNAKYKGKKEYVYIHPELAELLLYLRAKSKDDNGYIIAPEWKNRESLQQFTSHAFLHFYRLSGTQKKISFYNLRHTYINALFALMGEEALSQKHKKETAVKHYLSKKRALKIQEGQLLFNIGAKDFLSI